MSICIRQLSDMLKVRSYQDMVNEEIRSVSLFKGESFSYQISVQTNEIYHFKLTVNSELKDYIKVYEVKNSVMDYACPDNTDDLLSNEPGLMPDMLMPLELQNGYISARNALISFWIHIELPQDICAGEYSIKVELVCENILQKEETTHNLNMAVSVLDETLMKQELMYSQWIHLDCIASVHKVSVYSEKHWELIDKYISLAENLGINTLLTPVITPPLDTKEGSYRPCTQLVKIKYADGKYHFNFDLLDRWVELCLRNNIRYFEIAHLFSQAGPKYTPNIMVEENGESYYKFNSSVSYDSEEYAEFLKAFLPALTAKFTDLGIADNCYFHISDEPQPDTLDAYGYAYRLVRPLIGDCKIMDALSDVEFYDEGYVDVPVTITMSVDKFLPKEIEHQWVYYCCGPTDDYANRHLSFPSYRNRIIGLQLYKYGIEGFLHWGYNYYYARASVYEINPYITTSADKAFPSGDPFSVYPYDDEVYPSLRAYVFKKALEDISVCKMLERRIGKDKVIELIEEEAGMEITFRDYPRNHTFIPNVIRKIKSMF